MNEDFGRVQNSNISETFTFKQKQTGPDLTKRSTIKCESNPINT